MNTAMTLKKRIFSVLLTVILLFSMTPLSVFATNDAATVTAFDFSLGGDDAANYVLTAQPASTTATVSAKELTIAGLKVRDKPYDGKNLPATGDTSHPGLWIALLFVSGGIAGGTAAVRKKKNMP